MKKLFLLPILGILLFSCSKKELIHVNGIVHGYVYDNTSGDFLPDVTVSYIQGADSGSVVSDASGYFYIEGLDAGAIPLTFSKSGYASVLEYAWIDELQDYEVVRGGASVPMYDELILKLPRIGATVNGVVLKEVGSSYDIRPAANIRVMVYTNLINEYRGILPPVFTTTTNSRGEFSFAELPADVYLYLYIEPVSDEDNNYDYQSMGFMSSLSGPTEIRQILYRDNLGIYLVSSDLWAANGTFIQDFDVNESITLNFNQTVSKELTERDGYISLTGVALDPDNDISYSGSSITITPPTDLLNDANYTLSFLISSNTPGDLYGGSIAFHTAE